MFQLILKAEFETVTWLKDMVTPSEHPHPPTELHRSIVGNLSWIKHLYPPLFTCRHLSVEVERRRYQHIRLNSTRHSLGRTGSVGHAEKMRKLIDLFALSPRHAIFVVSLTLHPLSWDFYVFNTQLGIALKKMPNLSDLKLSNISSARKLLELLTIGPNVDRTLMELYATHSIPAAFPGARI